VKVEREMEDYIIGNQGLGIRDWEQGLEEYFCHCEL
jgi:hypothetical protein